VATVLVVDDRRVNRELVRTLLGYYGHRTIEADDGAEALELVRHEHPDLLIADVLMPRMDGYDLVREIRGDPATADMPVIFYTANYLEEEARPIADALGVRSVTKTGELSELLDAVHAALTERRPATASLVGDDDFSREHLRVLNAKLMDKIRELEDNERLHQLVDAAVAVNGDLGLPTTLKRIVVAARSLADARYAVIRVSAEGGEHVEFAQEGRAEGRSQLAATTSALSIPIHRDGAPLGSLHVVGSLTGGDFSDKDESLLVALATAAGSAIANARLHDDARRREAWLSASAEITSALLAADPAEALELVVRGARQVAGAKIAWIEVPTDQDTVTVGACDGPGAEEVRGRIVAGLEAPMLGEVAVTGAPIVIADAAKDSRALASPTAEILSVGPLMTIPLTASGECLGALLIGNGRKGRQFSTVDVEMATRFAGHAALALEFARAEANRQRMTVVEDRDRIARDLHDVVIQRLFAIGLRLDGFRTKLSEADARKLVATTEDLDETIDDIRNTVFSLSGRNADGRSLRAQLLRLGYQAVAGLHFAPRVRLVGPIDSVVPEHMHPDILATLSEALSNTARHARASCVNVLVRVGDGELLLRVTDDGCGLPAGRHESGLANLRHRALALGGTMSTSSGSGDRGLTLLWKVPVSSVGLAGQPGQEGAEW
jgi:signal transduction histidine kinase/CheY-like chemotaxis protein